MRYARAVDRNHAETVRVFRAMGCEVEDISGQSLVAADLLVSRGIRYAFVEIKDGAKPPSARRLTAREERFRDLCDRVGLHWWLVESPEDAAALVNAWARYPGSVLPMTEYRREAKAGAESVSSARAVSGEGRRR